MTVDEEVDSFWKRAANNRWRLQEIILQASDEKPEVKAKILATEISLLYSRLDWHYKALREALEALPA